MKIKKGWARTVFVFDKFVIKFPNIRPWQAIKVICRYIKRGSPFKWLEYDIHVIHSPQESLFKGILENWREFVFYQKNRSVFLTPTYFSLFGLINIQKAGKEAEIEGVNLWCQLVGMIGDEIWSDSHVFADPVNFCNHENHLRILDYGNIKIHKVLEKYGDRIFKEFDFSYVYKEN